MRSDRRFRDRDLRNRSAEEHFYAAITGVALEFTGGGEQLRT
jgi:hypothetical protein